MIQQQVEITFILSDASKTLSLGTSIYSYTKLTLAVDETVLQQERSKISIILGCSG